MSYELSVTTGVVIVAVAVIIWVLARARHRYLHPTFQDLAKRKVRWDGVGDDPRLGSAGNLVRRIWNDKAAARELEELLQSYRKETHD